MIRGQVDPPGDDRLRERVGIVIPALNEEVSLPLVLGEIPRAGAGWVVERVVVADNGSRDRTAEVAAAAGAEVVREPRRGYGSACLAGLEALRASPPDIVAFQDADYSDFGEDLRPLLEPLIQGTHDFVVGSRLRGLADAGAVPPHVKLGNRFASFLIAATSGARYTDLGPFRAIRWSCLEALQMRDPNFGWTVEMQVKAARARLRITEVPVRYRKRVGTSKISGTVNGTIRAGAKIIYSVVRYRYFS